MRAAPFVLLALLVLAPTVSAGYQPTLYYLKDGHLGPAQPGLLNATRPNATQPTLRPVPLDVPNLPAATFETGGLPHPPRLLGPVYLGVWVGPSPVAEGNLTVRLLTLNGTRTIPLGNATMALDANVSNLPNPASLVPPNPSDPQGSVAYELSKLLPAVTPPPKLLYLGTMDALFNATQGLVLSFTVTPADGQPAARGAAATIQYNATLTPSFLYVPWYSPDPPRTAAPYAASAPRGYQTAAAPPCCDDASPATAKGTHHRVPAPTSALLLFALIGLALALRRRQA
jgi:hypothetical protein